MERHLVGMGILKRVDDVYYLKQDELLKLVRASESRMAIISEWMELILGGYWFVGH